MKTNRVISDKSFEALVEGDEGALKQIIVSESRKLMGAIVRFVKVKSDAEEILQDIFIDTWNSRSIFSTKDDVYGYMYSRVRYKSLDFLKKNMLRKNTAYEFISDIKDNPNLDAQSLYEAKELAGIISVTVEKMPMQRRNVFKMSRYDGMKRSEIAESLNITPHTATQHLTKAIDELKKILL